ncbi:3'-5' exonuclease [Shinella curvata]|uniref:3'-5' exonuclease n=1 Tax=Shinella curvata TaxID=1817964 RepID=A0ABT8XLJ6_9HYPH|nr:3'-5' exonuclease [Shinella curvata]MCJ8056979.1 3'-5' exonuclease [Shinella curvata]MDO6124583.1 3'-5' exonuclease [Shinella curvata]
MRGIGDEIEMVRWLEETGRYRVLRKLKARAIANAPRPGFPMRGVIVDTETTGLSARKDEIIEIGIVAFSFDKTGNIGDVTGIYCGLQRPSIAIPANITRLTGITDAMVAGQTIDIARVQALIAPADLIVAHNAGFDRPFCETFSRAFAPKAWACSVSEVDWSARGFEGTKLGRAVDDCFALLEVLAQSGPDQGNTPFAELFAASQRSRVRIFAEHSPFEMKDNLKARGYRWSDGTDGRPKSWWVEVADDMLDEELRYLRAEIYRWPDADPPIRRLTALERFKA